MSDGPLQRKKKPQITGMLQPFLSVDWTTMSATTPIHDNVLTHDAVQTHDTVDYERTRAITIALAAPLSPEDQVAQSMPDASPTKWHLAHTTWFFETFLLAELPDHRPFDETFTYLFNSYYNAIGERQPRAERGLLTRPSLSTIHDYRSHVDARMVALLEDPSPEQHSLVELGVHHEQQHQELLLMDAQHLLSRHPFPSAYTTEKTEASSHQDQRWVAFDGGIVEVGHEGTLFSFDNESPRHRLLLEPFEISTALVTCGEFADFIADGGYRTPDWWLSDGWAAQISHGRERPLYWGEGNETLFDLHGQHEIDPLQPVSHLSFFEADAYARWADARLPTEAEWEIAAGHLVAENGEVRHRSGPTHHPVAPALGTTGFLGTLWEWTASPYVAYPGFHAAPGAVGEYNGKFMNNQYVLRGGSHMTSPSHTRLTYRNFFPPHTGWQASGLRLAR